MHAILSLAMVSFEKSPPVYDEVWYYTIDQVQFSAWDGPGADNGTFPIPLGPLPK